MSSPTWNAVSMAEMKSSWKWPAPGDDGEREPNCSPVEAVVGDGRARSAGAATPGPLGRTPRAAPRSARGRSPRALIVGSRQRVGGLEGLEDGGGDGATRADCSQPGSRSKSREVVGGAQPDPAHSLEETPVSCPVARGGSGRSRFQNSTSCSWGTWPYVSDLGGAGVRSARPALARRTGRSRAAGRAGRRRRPGRRDGVRRSASGGPKILREAVIEMPETWRLASRVTTTAVVLAMVGAGMAQVLPRPALTNLAMPRFGRSVEG